MQIFNWRQFLLHLAACWLFIFGFQTLAYAWDLDIANLLRNQSDQDYLSQLARKGISFDQLQMVENRAGVSRLVGLLVGASVSLLISFWKKWHWINTALVLLGCFILARNGWLGWPVMKYVFLSPGEIFKDNGSYYFLTNALFMIGLGLCIFLLPVFNRFIQKGVPSPGKKP